MEGSIEGTFRPQIAELRMVFMLQFLPQAIVTSRKGRLHQILRIVHVIRELSRNTRPDTPHINIPTLLLPPITPPIDLLQQIPDIPVPQLRLQLIQQLLQPRNRILRDLPHLLLILKKLPHTFPQRSTGMNRWQPLNVGLGRLILQLTNRRILHMQLLLQTPNALMQLLIVPLQLLVLSLKEHQFLEDVGHMFLGGRTRVLLQLEVILQPPDLVLQIGDDDLVLAVDLGLVVLLAQVDALVQFTEHRLRLPVEMSQGGIPADRHATAVALSNAVDDGIEKLALCFYLWLCHQQNNRGWDQGCGSQSCSKLKVKLLFFWNSVILSRRFRSMNFRMARQQVSFSMQALKSGQVSPKLKYCSGLACSCSNLEPTASVTPSVTPGRLISSAQSAALTLAISQSYNSLSSLLRNKPTVSRRTSINYKLQLSTRQTNHLPFKLPTRTPAHIQPIIRSWTATGLGRVLILRRLWRERAGEDRL